MRAKHPVLTGIAVTALIAGLGAAAIAYAGDDGPPSSKQVASARQTSDLLVNELVAALFQEFNETTPQNVAQGKQAISLIFNDHNQDMRLIGAFAPLLGGENDRPSGSFETTASSSVRRLSSLTSLRSGTQHSLPRFRCHEARLQWRRLRCLNVH